MAAKSVLQPSVLIESALDRIDASRFFEDPIVRSFLYAYAKRGGELLGLDAWVNTSENAFCAIAANARYYLCHFYKKDLVSGRVPRDAFLAGVRDLVHDIDLPLLQKAQGAPADVRDRITGALLGVAQLDIVTAIWSVDDAALKSLCAK